MRVFSRGVAIIAMAVLATAEVQADTVYCQTVTSTGTVCPTFVQLACLALSTISSQCGCPSTVPTKSVDYPCGGNPPRGCMGTSYIYETATPTCGGVTFTTEAVPTIAPTPTPTTAGLEACPTVYTTEMCDNCIRPMCVQLSKISQLCHCPTPVPTVTVNIDCPNCPTGCGTYYEYETAKPECAPTA
ncbi:hypothetical protein CPAR01_06788 [Colletotrichum paranaense]|uniref:Uncharacterized protein n=2 Tax=Colletotrichum acutatum species complex TaxID=2707335 RepID=A0ABQ9PNS4_9PEZI|nr:uncharacterized protein CPAR01_06788 [Colletotrichum paranaense]KAI3545572.1 hypothetical protein CSPX01_04878 [Colletotrichum filicis]KAK0373192.1 hypothetical protein CLIM01_09469 [Colletotrichum limetticola]KAK1540799.1 hypothetical protein CPAR01_06788 [Colletotrichum paranaense]